MIRSLILGSVLALTITQALAQRVIPAGQLPGDPSTFRNVCSNTVNNSTLANPSDCGTLIVDSINRLSSGAAWERWISATNLAAAVVGGAGVALVAPIEGSTSTLNISAATVVKAVPGRMVRVNVIVAGSTLGGVHNTTTTGAAAAANQIFAIPNVVGTYVLHWPMTSGIVVVPGTGQVVATSHW